MKCFDFKIPPTPLFKGGLRGIFVIQPRFIESL
jgi:hypothetical protein